MCQWPQRFLIFGLLREFGTTHEQSGSSVCLRANNERDTEAATGFNRVIHRQLSLKKESQACAMLARLVFRNKCEPRDIEQMLDSIVDLNTMCLRRWNARSNSNWLTRAPLKMQINELNNCTCAKCAQKNTLFPIMPGLIV